MQVVAPSEVSAHIWRSEERWPAEWQWAGPVGWSLAEQISVSAGVPRSALGPSSVLTVLFLSPGAGAPNEDVEFRT